MAPLGGIRRRPAEVLGQEEGQVALAFLEVFGIERAEHRVAGDAGIEALDDAIERLDTTDELIEGAGVEICPFAGCCVMPEILTLRASPSIARPKGGPSPKIARPKRGPSRGAEGHQRSATVPGAMAGRRPDSTPCSRRRTLGRMRASGVAG